jgi:hypothetical protein
MGGVRRVCVRSCPHGDLLAVSFPFGDAHSRMEAAMVKVIWACIFRTVDKVFFGVWLGLGWLIFLVIECFCWLCENDKSTRGERFGSTIL